MEKYKGYYSLLQFCPKPERLEYINVGIILSIPAENKFVYKFSQKPKRAEKLFGQQNKSHYKVLIDVFSERLKHEFSNGLDQEYFKVFSEKRANELRLTELLPLPISDIDVSLEVLFNELVGKEEHKESVPRVRTVLKKKFEQAGVLEFLVVPEPVQLPEFGIEVDVPYAYQNGSYNLIDPVRLNHASNNDALKEAGQRAIEGEWLAEHFKNHSTKQKLVVVGDFNEQSDNFYKAVRDIMIARDVSLYRMDEIDPLVKDIRENNLLHANN